LLYATFELGKISERQSGQGTLLKKNDQNVYRSTQNGFSNCQ